VHPRQRGRSSLPETADLRTDLVELAGDYLGAVLQEPVVQLRRLVIGEANRLPELAQLYYDRAPTPTLAALADAFGSVHDRGLLYAPESRLAAEHFAFLVIGRPIDQALFYGGPQVLASIDIDSYTRAGVDAFLASYRPR
jgi:TetR/AcrR family transcriptional repressor of mexJK operon